MGETETRVPIRERRKKSRGQAFLEAVSDNKSMLLVFAAIVAALAVILISILALKMPPLAVCALVAIEIALAACLHDVPIWLHGLVVAAQIVAGVLTGKTIFMLLCAVMYLVGIFVLKYIRE